MFQQSARKAFQGFSLAEILISLLIVAQIATFTIPKVLYSQQNAQKKAATKEVAAMISGAFASYTSENGLNANTPITAFTPYMNYVGTTTVDVDERPTLTNASCSGGVLTCLRMHNGGVLFYRTDQIFNGTAATNGIWFGFDPDASYSGSTSGEGKAVKIWIYYNGRLTTHEYLSPNACNNTTCWTGGAGLDPTWFNWN